jgi:hypothetical protein
MAAKFVLFLLLQKRRHRAILLLACEAALRERRAYKKPHSLPYLLVLPEDKKSDWFKMKKNMLIFMLKL